MARGAAVVTRARGGARETAQIDIKDDNVWGPQQLIS